MKEFKCVLLDWDRAYNLCKEVFIKIKRSGYRPEAIIAIARGGWFLARVLCDFLFIKDLYSVKVEHWGITATVTGEADLKCGLDESVIRMLSGKKILITDDVTDTGDSLRIVHEMCRKTLSSEIKTAVMQHKTTSSFIPDYYGEEMREWKWIIYPWSIFEDLAELTDRVSEGEMTAEEIREKLKYRFDVDVSVELVREVLERKKERGVNPDDVQHNREN